MKRGTTVGIIIIILIVIGFFMFNGSDSSTGTSSSSGSGEIDGEAPDSNIQNSDTNDDESDDASDQMDDPTDSVEDSNEDAVSGSRTVIMTPSGFSPDTVEISVGDSVTFLNQGFGIHWPATDVHPSHSIYPGSSIGKCGGSDADKIFDACKGLSKEESYTFTFDEAGNWRYHDHLNPGLRGTILVR